MSSWLARRLRRARGTTTTDEGRAIVEFVFLGVLLLLPLVYLVLTAARLQAVPSSRAAPTVRHSRGRRQRHRWPSRTSPSPRVPRWEWPATAHPACAPTGS
jgi:hypothetical protein